MGFLGAKSGGVLDMGQLFYHWTVATADRCSAEILLPGSQAQPLAWWGVPQQGHEFQVP